MPKITVAQKLRSSTRTLPIEITTEVWSFYKHELMVWHINYILKKHNRNSEMLFSSCSLLCRLASHTEPGRERTLQPPSLLSLLHVALVTGLPPESGTCHLLMFRSSLDHHLTPPGGSLFHKVSEGEEAPSETLFNPADLKVVWGIVSTCERLSGRPSSQPLYSALILSRSWLLFMHPAPLHSY